MSDACLSALQRLTTPPALTAQVADLAIRHLKEHV